MQNQNDHQTIRLISRLREAGPGLEPRLRSYNLFGGGTAPLEAKLSGRKQPRQAAAARITPRNAFPWLRALRIPHSPVVLLFSKT
jgi:hypothetical protein